jgi:glucose-1-phosphate adenylyltransferase
MMGADYYDTGESLAASTIGLGIGHNCSIEGAIIDKNARIGEGTVVKPFPVGTDFNEKNWVVRDGIVVIPKNAVIKPNTMIIP